MNPFFVGQRPHTTFSSKASLAYLKALTLGSFKTYLHLKDLLDVQAIELFQKKHTWAINHIQTFYSISQPASLKYVSFEFTQWIIELFQMINFTSFESPQWTIRNRWKNNPQKISIFRKSLMNYWAPSKDHI